MIRYSIFLFSVIGMAATALAHVNAGKQFNDFAAANSHGSSTVYQTLALETGQHLVLEKCALEDCSDTPQ